MYNITKFPICIISSYRTKSTVMANYLMTAYRDKIDHCFQEPDLYPSIEKQNFFKNFFTSDFFTKRNYIIKLHNYHSNSYPKSIYEYLLNSDDVFRIRMRRMNLITQVASYYIAQNTQRWHTYDRYRPKKYTVDIHDDLLLGAYRQVRAANRQIDKLVKFDLDLYYEQIPYLDLTNFSPSIPPQNYQHLINKIIEIHGTN